MVIRTDRHLLQYCLFKSHTEPNVFHLAKYSQVFKKNWHFSNFTTNQRVKVSILYAGIRSHDLLRHECPLFTTRPELPASYSTLLARLFGHEHCQTFVSLSLELNVLSYNRYYIGISPVHQGLHDGVIVSRSKKCLPDFVMNCKNCLRSKRSHSFANVTQVSNGFKHNQV